MGGAFPIMETDAMIGPWASAARRVSDRSMAKDARQVQPEEEEETPSKADGKKTCSVCGIKLSSYNPGPNCWQHTIGYPWRGPSAKPRYD
jgi:hypothetical protein